MRRIAWLWAIAVALALAGCATPTPPPGEATVAPRIILLHGGIYPVHLLMVSFGRFLTEMGYPQAQIRDPGNRDWSYSPYQESTEIAGLVAWSYERDGMRPMIIGHSQGGMQ